MPAHGIREGGGKKKVEERKDAVSKQRGKKKRGEKRFRPHF